MPKIFGRDMPPVVIGGAGVLAAYLVYTAIFPGDTPTTTTAKKPVVVAKSVGDTDYLDSDYSFRIQPMPATTTTKDSFKPLVFKEMGAKTSGPLSLDSYTYSGMAQLNGTSYGLLENSQTGEGDFVQPGQKWHEQWEIIKVEPDSLEARNDSGQITTLLAGAAATKTSGPAGGAAPGVAANPMMVGPIGSPDLSLQPDTGAQPQQRGRRGGRRGRGGNGGGGNGGVGAAVPDGG